MLLPECRIVGVDQTWHKLSDLKDQDRVVLVKSAAVVNNNIVWDGAELTLKEVEPSFQYCCRLRFGDVWISIPERAKVLVFTQNKYTWLRTGALTKDMKIVVLAFDNVLSLLPLDHKVVSKELCRLDVATREEKPVWIGYRDDKYRGYGFAVLVDIR